jgi:hypothetical protein
VAAVRPATTGSAAPAAGSPDGGQEIDAEEALASAQRTVAAMLEQLTAAVATKH